MSGQVFNANFVQRSIQDKIHSILYGPVLKTGLFEPVVPFEHRRQYAKIARVMETLNRRRGRVWGAWKDHK